MIYTLYSRLVLQADSKSLKFLTNWSAYNYV